MSLNEVFGMAMRDLRSLVNNYQMAQAARSFGNIPPDRFNMILESELERDKEDRRRDLGGWGELSAELERTGQTWRTYANGQRIEKLQMLAEVCSSRFLSQQEILWWQNALRFAGLTAASKRTSAGGAWVIPVSR